MRFPFYVLLLLGFLSCKETPPQLPDPLEAGWEGESVCEVVEENDRVRTLKCTFPPGVGHEKHFHARHFGYTLKGGTFKITDDTGTRTVDVPAGYSFYKDSITTHEVLNVGDKTAEFLIVEILD
ncbi:MAG: cupin domain-containing protein [Nonlabens sp.]